MLHEVEAVSTAAAKPIFVNHPGDVTTSFATSAANHNMGQHMGSPEADSLEADQAAVQAAIAPAKFSASFGSDPATGISMNKIGI